MFEELDNWAVESEEFLDLQEKCEKMPETIRQDMKKAGMFKKERKNVDEYINEETFEVVLDRKLLDRHPLSFSATLRNAIKKDDDFMVYEVIEEMGGVRLVVETVVKSGNKKFINKLLKRKSFTYDAMEYMVKSGDKQLLLKVAELENVPSHIRSMIIKTGERGGILSLLNRKDLAPKNLNEILEMEDKEYNSLICKKLED